MRNACIERDTLGRIAIEGGEYRAYAGRRPLQVRPPLRNHGVLRRLDALAGSRRENIDTVAASRHAHTFDGLSPGMLRQFDQRPMHRNHGATPYLDVGLYREFWTQVIVGPIGIVLPRLDQRDVERSESRTDIRQIPVIAGVP